MSLNSCRCYELELTSPEAFYTLSPRRLSAESSSAAVKVAGAPHDARRWSEERMKIYAESSISASGRDLPINPTRLLNAVGRHIGFSVETLKVLEGALCPSLPPGTYQPKYWRQEEEGTWFPVYFQAGGRGVKVGFESTDITQQPYDLWLPAGFPPEGYTFSLVLPIAANESSKVVVEVVNREPLWLIVTEVRKLRVLRRMRFFMDTAVMTDQPGGMRRRDRVEIMEFQTV